MLFLQLVRNCPYETVYLYRLCQMCIHPCCQRCLHIFRKSICCHGNDWNLFSIWTIFHAPYSSRCFITIHLRHHNIHKNCIKTPFRMSSKQIQYLFSIFSPDILYSFILKNVSRISAFSSLSSAIKTRFPCNCISEFF